MSGSLHASVATQVGSCIVDVSIDVAPGEVLAVQGPNGAGKTTLLRSIAGVHPLVRGRVVLGDVVLEDTSAGIRSAPEDRGVGMVFQDRVLFDHLDALGNVAFGLRARGTSRREAERRAHEWLERLDVRDIANARPREISGGQAQRVALARALAIDPVLVLLDEPLAALDASSRAAVREVLRSLLPATAPSIVVTHDAEDAAAFADRVVVMESGRVVRDGTPAQVAATWPASRDVARETADGPSEGRTPSPPTPAARRRRHLR